MLRPGLGLTHIAYSLGGASCMQVLPAICIKKGTFKDVTPVNVPFFVPVLNLTASIAVMSRL